MANKISFILCLIISIFLLAYTSYRAFALSITFDEGTSYIEFARSSFADIISQKIISPNNHLLNTLGMKLFSHFFGSSEWVLRLHSVIAHIFYLFFSYQIVKRLGTTILIVSGFVLLNFNPYLLDFFSLARGYGLAVTFMMGSIYFLFKILDNPLDKTSTLFSFLLASLAVVSNYSLLLFFAALFIIYNIIILVNSKKISPAMIFSKNKIPLLISIVLTMIVYLPIKKLTATGTFYFGGTTGFWKDTAQSIIVASLYDQPYTNTASMFLNYFLIAVIIIMSLTLVVFVMRKGLQKINSFFVISFLLLVFTSLISIIQHLFDYGNFLTDRMAVFFIPLFFLSFIFFIDYIRQHLLFKNLINLLVIFFTLPFFIHTVKSANFVSTYNWKFEAQTKEMLSNLKTEIIAEKKELKNIKLRIGWHFVSSINFYKITKNINWLNFVVPAGYARPQFFPEECKESSEGLNGDYDYYYMLGADTDTLKLLGKTKNQFLLETNSSDADSLLLQGRKVIKKYTISNSVLFKK